MTLDQAIAGVVDNKLLVVTKSGIVYCVGVHALEVFGDYVYGYRLTPRGKGPFARGPTTGSIKWFFLSNVSLAETT